MKKLFAGAALCSLVMAATAVVAQEVKRCATDEIVAELAEKNPSLKAALDICEQDIQHRTANISNQTNTAVYKTTSSYPIALAFHVVLSQAQINQIGGVQGIYDRVVSQIEVLNIDFNAQNTETIPAPFAPLKGNPNMNFGLAHTKPDGTGTIGIEILTKPAAFTGFDVSDGSVKRTANGGLDPWDNTRYLNVWITNITNSGSGEILGYAYHPKLAALIGDAKLMGVVVDYLAFGKRNNLSQTFIPNADKGRTMVHEFGHFFTLNHIWGNTAVGNGTCNDDDGVDDTPKQSDANQSICPSYPKLPNCNNTPEGQMFMNYMDYVQDVCMSMFSKGQVTRMHSEFAAGGGSVNLPKNVNLFSWPTSVGNISMKSEIDIVPNPSNGVFTLTHGEGLKQVVINNMLGQVVKQISIANQQSGTMNVNITDAGKGMYTIQCLYNEGMVSKKVIVQ